MFKTMVLVAALSLVHGNAAPPVSGFRIVFLPFQIQTNKPVTQKTIFDSGFFRLEVRHQGLPYQIRALITKGADKPIDNKFIRLVIQDWGNTYFFDSHGNGITNKNESVQIDRPGFEKLISLDKLSLDLKWDEN